MAPDFKVHLVNVRTLGRNLAIFVLNTAFCGNDDLRRFAGGQVVRPGASLWEVSRALITEIPDQHRRWWTRIFVQRGLFDRSN